MQFPSFDLNGRVALVTGGGRGIGRAIALALAHAGADVAISGRTTSQLQETAEDISKLGRKSLAVTADVSKLQDIENMVHTVVSEFGRLDILVNNAGINKRVPSLEVTEELWDSIVDTNLKGTFFCCQAAGRIMLKQGKGKIINICSLTSQIGMTTIAPYGATKSGVLGLTRSLAAEWARYGINVNAIGPGYHETDLTRPLLENKAWLEKLMPRIPIGRVGTTEDLMGAAVFLASDASNYVSGEIIYVDGGFLSGWNWNL
ncbi:MAG TPA: glucose 1-dehydrogenase [Candidatus Limnocylindrales bacterium]|nr:glucose 1-dehydrogenase [Candidatus Limnocylindrales bacterium]